MLKFGFSNETKEKVSKTLFNKAIDKFYKTLRSRVDKKLNKRDGLIDLVLINDDAMKVMNAEYRKKNSPTDVISFAYLDVTEHEAEKGDVIAGDIFISVETAKKQAKKNKHDLKREMETLFVHGLLHCFGFSHKTDKQEKEMDKWAKKVLE